MDLSQNPDWLPLDKLPPFHYALGRLVHGGEAHIYNAGGYIVDVASGHKVLIAGWKPLDVHAFNRPLLT